MGTRELAQMSASDLVTLLVIGDLIAETLVSEDISLTTIEQLPPEIQVLFLRPTCHLRAEAVEVSLDRRAASY
jgi:hypothetical protein